MRHGSLFAGIGGFDLAAEWMDWENIFQVEIDKYCIKVLEKNFPNVKRYGDIKKFDGTEYRGTVDILTGGFPCQGFSVAGKQRGKSDSRWLWPEMFRIVRGIQPAWVIGENVPGIIKLALEDICLALESEGYAVQPFIIPSASIGAWDKRERVWIIAYNNKWSRQKYRLQTGGKMFEREIKINSNIESTISKQSDETWTGRNGLSDSTGDIASIGRENSIYGNKPKRQTGKRNNNFKKHDWWKRGWIEVASELCGSDAGVSHRMDRIKELGNSVNPYVAYELFKVIEQYDNEQG